MKAVWKKIASKCPLLCQLPFRICPLDHLFRWFFSLSFSFCCFCCVEHWKVCMGEWWRDDGWWTTYMSIKKSIKNVCVCFFLLVLLVSIVRKENPFQRKTKMKQKIHKDLSTDFLYKIYRNACVRACVCLCFFIVP